MRGRIRRIYQKKRFDRRILQPGELLFRNIPVVCCCAADVNGNKTIILNRWNLHIRSKYRSCYGNLIPFFQKTVMAEGFKNVHHRSTSAFRRENLRFCRKLNPMIKGGLQICIQDYLRVRQAAAGGWIIISDHGICQFLKKSVFIKSKSIRTILYCLHQEPFCTVFRIHGDVKTFPDSFLLRMPCHVIL